MKQIGELCSEAGFPVSETMEKISQLHAAYPGFYHEAGSSTEQPPVVIADPDIPGLGQIISKVLPPVLLLPSRKNLGRQETIKAFSHLDPALSVEAFNAILSSAEKHALLLQEFMIERREGRETIDSLNEIIFSVDITGRLIYISSVISRYHFDPKTVVGKSIYDFVHPEDRELVKARMQNLGQRPGSSSGFRVIDGKGNIRYVRTSSKLVQRKGKKPIITGVMADRTEESKREKEILKLTQAVEQSANVIVITDLEGTIEFVNPAFESSTGYSREEAIGKNPRILKTDFLDKEVYAELWGQICSGKVWEGLFHNKRKDGSTYWEKSVISPIKNDADEIINFIAVKQDISQDLAHQKELEQAKEEAERANKLKSEFLANMSHEIRTPLNVILGFTNLLLEETDEEDKRNQLRLINDSGKSLLELINDILDFSKIEADKLNLEPEEFSPRQLLTMLSEMFSFEAERKGIGFHLEIADRVPKLLQGDQFRIRQILMNLLSNAIKFTDEGSVSLKADYADKYPRTGASGGAFELTVTDTGIGIGAEQRKLIFNPFEQLDGSAKRRFSGTGLGLSITRKLVLLMGGTINLRSKPGEGSSFAVVLPLDDLSCNEEKVIVCQEPEKMVEEEKRGKDGEVKPLLIAEDNTLNQELMKLLIAKIGYQCEIAENGKIALDKLEEREYSLLLLDMQMPVMDGLETIQRIRQNPRFAQLPVIALTANAMKGDEEKFRLAGCTDYLAKPVDRDLLKAKLARYL